MKLLIVFAFGIATIASSVSAASLAYYSPLHSVLYPAAHVYSAHSSSLLTPSQQQYHTQDEFGQYAYGYREPLSAKQEVRSLDGTTRGSYSYRDPEGKLQMVTYTADSNGFHVAATNLPRAVAAAEQSNTNEASAPAAIADTVEVAAARAAHLAAHQTAELRLAASESTPTDNRSGFVSANSGNVRTLELPHPVEDTPAVALAKAEHLKRFEQEKLRNEIIGGASAAPSATLVRSVVPGVYTYGYPFKTRLLATGYYF